MGRRTNANEDMWKSDKDKEVGDTSILESSKKSALIQLAESKWIENEIYLYSKSDWDDNLNDLAQDIYLQILEDDKLLNLSIDELKAYVVQIIKYSLFSSTSKYYYKYKKPNKNLADIDTVYDREDSTQDEED